MKLLQHLRSAFRYRVQIDGDKEQLRSLIHAACQGGDLGVVQKLLIDCDVQLDEFDDDGWTPLHHAINGGSIEVVEYLVEEQGVDLGLFTSTELGQATLNLACSAGHLDVIRYLADNGGHRMMDSENEGGLRPLHIASLAGQLVIVKYLIEEHAVNVQAADSELWTAMHYACLSGNLLLVKYLAEEHCADCDAREMDGWTPLHCAANKGHLHVVKYLSEERRVKVDATVSGSCQGNALCIASFEGHVDVVKYFTEEFEFDVDEPRGAETETVFHKAARFGQLGVIKYYLEDLHSNNPEGRSRMLFARNYDQQTACDLALNGVESESEYANQEVVDYLQSYVSLLAVASNGGDSTEPAVKLNPRLSEQEEKRAQRVYKVLCTTPAHEVAYHILGFLCLSDVSP